MWQCMPNIWANMWLDMQTHVATLKFHNLSKFRTYCIKRPTVYEMKKYTGWNNKHIGHQRKYPWTSEQSNSKLFKMKHEKDSKEKEHQLALGQNINVKYTYTHVKNIKCKWL